MSIDVNDKKDWFFIRTMSHIESVQNYWGRIKRLFPDACGEHSAYLHDDSKFNAPEHDPYVEITWKYKKLADGVVYELSADMEKLARAATFHHIKSNEHHPEYWDASLVDDPVNPDDRDKPSGVIVDATQMPDYAICEMLADWLAMSDEKNSDPKKWADMNIGKRWDFTTDQVGLIYDIIDRIPVDRDGE